MQLLRVISGLVFALGLSSCSYPVTMSSVQGDRFVGLYRYGREDSGVMQIRGPENEVLVGRFVRVDRTMFAEGYERTFGRGTIEMDGPDLSRHGNSFGGLLASSTALHETAYTDASTGFAGQPTRTVSGPLFYWVASLQGDRRSVLGCYLVGSSYTGNGFGRCKSQSGTEYRVDF